MSASGKALLFAGLLLGASLLLGAILIALAQRWWRKEASPRLSPSDQLAQFRSLYERGGISEEEFNRVRTLLLEQIRRETMMPAAGAAASVAVSGSGDPARSAQPSAARPETPPPAGPPPPPELPPAPPPDGPPT